MEKKLEEGGRFVCRYKDERKKAGGGSAICVSLHAREKKSWRRVADLCVVTKMRGKKLEEGGRFVCRYLDGRRKKLEEGITRR